MDRPSSGYTVSSGRRPPPVRSGCLIAAGVMTIIGVMALLEVARDQPPPEAPPPPTATPAARATATATATPAPPIELSSDWVVVSTAVTPTPWVPPTPPPSVRREPSPTPSAAACISASYDAQQSLAAWGNVLISIRATNRCRRVLQPTDVLFRITGYRDGAVVQTAQGSPFEEIYPGRTTDFGIALPGSLDWYDRITVEVLD